MIPAFRRRQYARDYIGFGMVNEASDRDDRMKPEILAVRTDPCHAAKNWELMADIARHLAENYTDQSGE